MAHLANRAQSVRMETDHIYGRRDASHITPTKNFPKKMKPEDTEISNPALLQAINSLAARFDSQDKKLEDISDKLRQNSIMIATVSKSVEFNSEEIKECKQRCGALEKQTTALVKSNEELRSKTSELKRYKRRWNLRIKGMKEQAAEDSRKEVVELFSTIAPHLAHKLEDVVDSVHRIGKMEDIVK